jgi:hypothetical protein
MPARAFRKVPAHAKASRIHDLIWIVDDVFEGGMQLASATEQIESKYRALASVLNERARRHWVATEARACGWGRVSAIGNAAGMSSNTIRRGLAELADRDAARDCAASSRLCRPGGGRKRLTETDLQLSIALDRLVAP